MEALKKLHEARKMIKELDLKKQGQNTYSKYAYYTPEQVSYLKTEVFNRFNLIDQFSLKRTELGLMAQLVITDLDSGKQAIFEIATEIPEIKATNVAQQLGGAVTYSERYLVMVALDIKDNNLDFDTDKPQKKEIKAEDDKPWIDDKTVNKVMETMREEKPVMMGSLTFKDNKAIYDYVMGKYKVSKANRAKLEDEMNCPLNEAFLEPEK